MSVRGPKKKKISSDRTEGSETVSSTTSSTSSPAVDAKSSKKARKQKHKEATEVKKQNKSFLLDKSSRSTASKSVDLLLLSASDLPSLSGAGRCAGVVKHVLPE